MSPNCLKRISCLALFLLVAVVSPACTQKQVDGDLHLVLWENPKSLDPSQANDANAGYVQSNSYETLLQYHYLKRPYELTTLLASEMPTYSPDGLTVKIKIKEGVLFQDDPCFPGGKGRELTAEDFIYQFKRLADPKVKSDGWWTLDGKIIGLNAWRDGATKTGNPDYSKPVEGMQAPDPHTLVLKLTRKYPQLNYVLALLYTAPMAKEAIEKYGPEIGRHLVGTGPYVMKEFIENAHFIFEKNPGFHGENFPLPERALASGDGCESKGKLTDAECSANPTLSVASDFDYGKALPLSKRLIIHISRERQPGWLNFIAGQYDHIPIPKDNVQAATDGRRLKPALLEKGMDLSVDESTTEWWLGFNMDDPVLGKNKYLRHAIALAYDAAKDVELFGFGVSKPAGQILPPSILGYNKRLGPKKYDIEEAKKMLVKAGFPGGRGLPVFTYDLEGSSLDRQYGEFLKNQMAQIGINITVRLNTRPELFDRRKRSKHQIIRDGWIADYPDAENFMQLLYGPSRTPGPNNSNFNNAEFDKLYLQMAGMAPSPARQKIIDRMTEIMQDEQPWVPNWIATIFNARQGWLKNYVYSDFAYNVYKYYRVDLDRKKELIKKF